MRIFKEVSKRKSISILRETPSHIEYAHGLPALASFPDGQKFPLNCISCLQPRCMFFDAADIECNSIDNFPHDKSTNTCPVNAIEWDAELDVPKINSERCINCGICIRRCPVGAIYFDVEVKVNTTHSPNTVKRDIDSSSRALQAEQIISLNRIERSGSIIVESDELLESIYMKLFRTGGNYHNIIGRNLLISLGCRCAMRRIGDVYTRMDAVYESGDGCLGAVEIEFGGDTLDASRGILDDVAVLNVRYGVHKDTNMPLVICLQLPNARQGYWQVVKDIKTIEDITISTITIGAMMLLNWNGYLLMPDDVAYYLDYDNMNLRSTISQQIYRDIHISNRLLGILEPMK